MQRQLFYVTSFDPFAPLGNEIVVNVLACIFNYKNYKLSTKLAILTANAPAPRTPLSRNE
jgi:hypothetical protein